MFRKVILALSLLALIAYAEPPVYYLYKDQFISIESTQTGYRLGDTQIAKEDVDQLPKLLKPYQSNKVIFPGEITMNDVLHLGPVLSKYDYEIYFINKDGEIKSLLFH